MMKGIFMDEHNDNMNFPETPTFPELSSPDPAAVQPSAQTAMPDMSRTPEPPPPEQPVRTSQPGYVPRQGTIPQQGGYPQSGYPQNDYQDRYPQGYQGYPQQSGYYGAPMPFRYTPGDSMPPPVPPYFPPQYGIPQTPPPPPVPKEKVHPMNRRIYMMALVIGILVFLLCVFCIGSDILHGALGDDSILTKDVTVELNMQEKPELDPADENVTEDGEYTVRGVAELVKPSIVEVYNYSSVSRKESTLSGTGSGIIISEDGYIVTNAHVVEGTAFSVILDNEEEYEAELIGIDHKTDLAVLKISAVGLVPAVLGDSDETYVGEKVVAIGNPAGLTNTVTQGIVSAIGRQVRAENNAYMMDCIQTDAAISPGNSGGALVNMYGQVIGITSSKYASEFSGAYEGLGFAITINEALPILEDLMENGYVEGRFRIGITFASMNTGMQDEIYEATFGTEVPEELRNALWISEVSEDCDISNTDLQPNDFILEFEGVETPTYDDVLEVLDGYKGGDTVTAYCARVDGDDITYFNIEFMLESDTSGNY